MAFGQYLFAVRRLKGLSTYEAAAKSDMSQSQLSKLERDVNRPTRESLRRLAVPSAYGCPWLAAAPNVALLLGLAFHWFNDDQYAPERLEFWPPDISLILKGADMVVRHLPNLSPTGSLLALQELWSALHLPGWRPPHLAGTPNFTDDIELSRSIWIWSLWSVIRDRESEEDLTLGHSEDEIDAIRGAIVAGQADTVTRLSVETLAIIAREQFGVSRERESQRKHKLATESSGGPEDPEWAAIKDIWSRLTPVRRQLVRVLAEELAQCSERPSDQNKK